MEIAAGEKSMDLTWISKAVKASGRSPTGRKNFKKRSDRGKGAGSGEGTQRGGGKKTSLMVKPKN